MYTTAHSSTAFKKYAFTKTAHFCHRISSQYSESRCTSARTPVSSSSSALKLLSAMLFRRSSASSTRPRNVVISCGTLVLSTARFAVSPINPDNCSMRPIEKASRLISVCDSSVYVVVLSEQVRHVINTRLENIQATHCCPFLVLPTSSASDVLKRSSLTLVAAMSDSCIQR